MREGHIQWQLLQNKLCFPFIRRFALNTLSRVSTFSRREKEKRQPHC
jgi:hypothetical protein